MTHPYKSLPRKSFWKTGVAQPGPHGISDLYQPRFKIDRDTAIMTAGSCFARNIARALKARGCRWLETETAPPGLSPASAARLGYGLFSCRTGNIYSAAALRQWIDWAFGTAPPATETWIDDKTERAYDPFRPEIEPGGFEDAHEVTRLRAVTLQALKQAVSKADVFIFTLGLTEAWHNTTTGHVYPACPGTVAGRFDADHHRMINADYPSVHADMMSVVKTLTGVNPKLQIVLTVSPIPLTATAEPDAHVLAATTYSKSVLRAVAGALAQSQPNVSYFPSYEVFSAPVFRGMFFDPTLSKAEPAGVNFAMAMFFGAHGFTDGPVAEVGTKADPQMPSEAKCPDYILEYYAPK